MLSRDDVVTEDRVRRGSLCSAAPAVPRSLHRDGEAYRCLREAFANDPDSGDIAHALRTAAMSRGEWGLTAELLYREIAAAASGHGDASRETAALYNDLGMVFDQKLGDAEQAQRCYEHALTLDPALPAAPKPLARLYELAVATPTRGHVRERGGGLPPPRWSAAPCSAARRLRRAGGRGDDASRLIALAARLGSDPASDDDLAAPRRWPTAPAHQALETQLRQTTDPVLTGDLRRQIIEVRRPPVTATPSSATRPR